MPPAETASETPSRNAAPKIAARDVRKVYDTEERFYVHRNGDITDDPKGESSEKVVVLYP